MLYLVRNFLVSAVLLGGALVCTTAHAADPRIVTVDVVRLINDLPEAVSKKKELDTLSQQAQKKLDAKAKDLQALQAKLEKSKVPADSSEAESFRTQVRDFERMRSDAKADLDKRFAKVNKELTEKVLARVEAYAKGHNIDLVLDKGERGRGPVLFGAASIDITEQVLKGSEP